MLYNAQVSSNGETREWHTSSHLAQLGEVDFQGLRVVLEAQGDHSVEYVLPTDGLALLHLALLRRLRRDEADEL